MADSTCIYLLNTTDSRLNLYLSAENQKSSRDLYLRFDNSRLGTYTLDSTIVTIRQWIDLAVMQKVKQLDLAISDENLHFMLPSCLVDSDSLKSLKKVVIELEDLETITEADDNYGFTLRELFAQVSHVEYLSIYCIFVPTISMTCETPEEGFPSLPNLKTLVTTIACCLMDVLICILKCSPNLESFHIIINKGITPEEVETFIDEFDEVERRRTLTRHLKRVEFPEFNGEKELLATARFLLEHGNALEEMVFAFW
ncbi:F-box domain containing protein [Tanacetum coccineum]